MKSFLNQLVKRGVFRTISAYIGISYAILLVSQSLERALVLPTWFDTKVISLLVLGLVPVTILAWAFQFTSDGLVRNSDIPKADIDAQYDKILPIDIAAIAITLFVIGVLGLRALNPAALNSDQSNAVAVIEVPEKSIAVLPFEAMSSEPSDMYLGRAIAEETLNRLAKIHDLKVTALTSAFALSDRDIDVKQIGAQLAVAYILKGSVRSSDAKIRITAQLIRTSDGYRVWTDTFEPEVVDLFLVEDRIVAAISRTLQIRLGVGLGSDTAPAEGVDPQAYETYLNGLGLWSLRMRNDANRIDAFNAFKRATELDPNFAEAWTALGSAGISSKGSPLSRNKKVFSQTINNALERALQLEPNNVRALLSMAYWRMSEHLDFEGARQLLEKATTIDPKRAELGYGAYWAMIGEPEKALAVQDRIASLDPLNYSSLRIRADLQATVGLNHEALSFYNECQAKTCLREGFIAFGTTVALLSNNPNEIAKWKSLWSEFHDFIKTLPQSALPQVVKVVPTYLATEFDDPGAEQLQLEMIKLFETSPVTDTIGQWGPTFARFMPLDLFIDTLELAYERGDLFGASFALMPFYGQNNYPDQLLKHPRYHTLWERPGLKELQALRRANGETAGLPILASLQEP